MAIVDDVAIDYVNKIVSRNSGAGSTVYTVNQLYSFIMDTFDELAQMDNKVPMSAQTPTSYTMINGWYLQEDLTKYLTGGAIQTNGYDDEIRTLLCSVTGWTNFVSDDIGDTITSTETSDTGTVLDYDNASYKVWIRMTSATDLFDDDDDVYTGAGTGEATSVSVSTTGEHVFANPYTLGTLEGTPQLYIFQDGEKIDPDWWGTGHFDVLIKVTESDVDIDSKAITVFNRTFSDLYDHFEITLTTAGQNAVPLSTADDLNNQTAEATVEGYQDGTEAYTIAVAFSFSSPYSYDIGDGSGTKDYEVQIDCDGERLSKVYEVCKYWTRTGSTKALETTSDANTRDGEEYLSANEGTYAEVKGSPFGTFAGGKFFGARSVYFINLHADDVQAFQLIDKANTTRYPPNYQSFIITNVVAGDRCAIFLADDGSVDKTQYYLTTTVSGAGTVVVSGAIPNDTPASGTIVLYESTDGSEEVLAFASWDTSTFTLVGTTDFNYGVLDTAYVPYIYSEAISTSVSDSVVYVTDRSVITRVRLKGILPFETTGTFGSTGYSAAAIRTTDSIVTV